MVSRAGLASRRDAEEWIVQGRVTVNGRVINSPALDVTANDVVAVDGKPLPPRERTRLFMFHKPRGLMTTHADPEGRPTVFDNLPEGLPRLRTPGCPIDTHRAMGASVRNLGNDLEAVGCQADASIRVFAVSRMARHL